MKKLETIDGETLMSKPLQPLNFVVDTLISQGLHILAACTSWPGRPRWASPGWPCGWLLPWRRENLSGDCR